MQQPEKAATETKAERGRRFHLVGEACIVQAQLAHRRAQVLELRGVHGKQAAEHHRHGGAEAGQGLVDWFAIVGDGVADTRVRHLLDRGGEHADLAGAKFVHRRELGREHAGAIHIVGSIRAHHADALALFQHAVDDAHQHDHAEINVVPAVDQQRLQRGIAVAFRRRQARDDRFQNFGDVQSGLGRNLNGVRCIETDDVLDLLLDLGRLGRRQVHFIEHRHDLVTIVDCLVDVRQCLRLDALTGIDHEERSLAGGKRPVDLIGKVDVARAYRSDSICSRCRRAPCI